MTRKYILVILDDFDQYSSIPTRIENAICGMLDLATVNASTQLFTDSAEDKAELLAQINEEPS